MSIQSFEIIFRGIYQKALANKISRTLVLAAVKEGKKGISFGRYSDSPERNGIPAKLFGYIADSHEELEAVAAQYEPKQVDVSIALDDTLTKGVESWAWYGLQPLNAITQPGGTLIITSMQAHDDLVKHMHVKDAPYHLAIIKSEPSFAGLWVYKDDGTDARCLGAALKACPQICSMASLAEAIRENLGGDAHVEAARASFEDTRSDEVKPGEGNTETPFTFELLTWKQMRQGVVIDGVGGHNKYGDSDGGYVPGRNEKFKKWSTRSMRPVIQFDKCTKCTLCWIACPDTCFDVTPDGYYDANMDACCGCGVCEAICPVKDCITMTNEIVFEDRDSQYEMWNKNKGSYQKYVDEKLAVGKVENRHPITGLAGAFSGAGLDGGHTKETSQSWSIKDH
ncbi:MAG: (4Fe-4S)-binding protein [bacterium]|nr:(4Fe-4S)-binding protein [bacterium]